ncbi:CcmD family protein [Rubrolithibacter danxiaensis]|uniref:CcmD family protein n=1 Tax=Rubrolithibacter danxiaensis TaxID=3390805 RepID=UPI003BF85B0A
MKKIIILFVLSFVTTIVFAQNAENGMAVDLRASGKIYVVVAVIAVIFIGLFIYLFSIDRRIKKIERNQ